MRAAGDAPLAGLAIEAREQPWIGLDPDRARRARRELDAFEAEQAHALLPRRFREPDLRHVCADDPARVRQGERGGDRFTAARFEISIGERRVAQAVTEGVHGLVILLRVPAVADLCALVVADRGGGAPWRGPARQARGRAPGR